MWILQYPSEKVLLLPTTGLFFSSYVTPPATRILPFKFLAVHCSPPFCPLPACPHWTKLRGWLRKWSVYQSAESTFAMLWHEGVLEGGGQRRLLTHAHRSSQSWDYEVLKGRNLAWFVFAALSGTNMVLNTGAGLSKCPWNEWTSRWRAGILQWPGELCGLWQEYRVRARVDDGHRSGLWLRNPWACAFVTVGSVSRLSKSVYTCGWNG